MDTELSERIILVIVTNLNTRFLILPLRSETIGDIRGTIRSYHMDLFPKWGEVIVNALEIELFDGRFRVADPLPIRHLFWNASQAVVFAELIPSGTCTIPYRNLPKNTDEKFTPFPPKSVGLVEGAFIYSNHGKSVSDHENIGGRYSSDVVALEIEDMRKKRKERIEIDERDGVNNVLDMQIIDNCPTAEIVEPVTKKHCISRGNPGLEQQEQDTVTLKSSADDSVTEGLLVLKSRHKSWKTDGPANCQESCPIVAEKELDEAVVLISNPLEGGVVVKSGGAVAIGPESNEGDGSRSSSQSDHPAAEKLQSELHPRKDSVTKTLMPLESMSNPSSNDLSGSGGPVGLPGLEKKNEKPVAVTSKPEDADVGRKFTVADVSAGSSSSESEAQTSSRQKKITRKNEADKVEVIGLATPEKKVRLGNVQILNAISEGNSLEVQNRSKHSMRHENGLYSGTTTSGGSTGDRVSQGKNSRGKSVDLQRKHHSSSSSSSSSSDGNNECDSVKGSISGGRPTESSAGKDSDLNSSDGSSTTPSSDRSDSEELGSSSGESDGSEDVAPRGPVKDVSTPKVGNGAIRTVGRRSAGAILDHKYQHLLDSQDGFDELISLSQQKLMVFPSSQQELHSVAGPDDTIAPVSLAGDNLSIDVVLETQASAKDLPAKDRAENKSKEKKLTRKESVARNRLVLKESMVPAEPIQDKVDGGENVHCTSGPSSAVKTRKTDLHLSVTGELMVPGGVTEYVPEPGVEAPQIRLDDSQKIRAAVQLARMSTPTKGVNSVLRASPTEKRVVRDKGISRKEDQGLIKVRESAVHGFAEVQSMKCSVHDQGQNGGSPSNDDLVISLHEDDDQSLEASRLSAPNRNMGAGENLGMVLLALEGVEATRKPEITVADEVASEGDFGKIKHGKRRCNPFQESEDEGPSADRRDQTDRLEADPSLGSRDLPDTTSDELGNKEHSGKNSSFEYRDLRKKSSLTNMTSPLPGLKLSLKRVKGLKSLNAQSSKGAEGKSAEVKSSFPQAPFLKEKGPDDEGTGVVGDGDSPSELVQRPSGEDDPSNSRLGNMKMKKKRGGLLENRGELHVELNLKDLEKEAGNGNLHDTDLGPEEPSNILPRRESKDDEKGQERLTALGSHDSADVRLNGEPAWKKMPKERRRLSFEFSETSSRPKLSSTGEDRDPRQYLSTEPSILPFQQVYFVSDRSLQQVLATEPEDLEGDEKHGKISTDSGADTESPVVLDEKKGGKRNGRTQKVESAEAHVSQVPQDNVEEEHFTGDVPTPGRDRGGVLSKSGAKIMRSSLGEKMNKKWDKLKKPKKQSKPDVTEEMEQLDIPRKGEEDAIAITRVEEGSQQQLSLKKKKKKGSNVVGNSTGEDIIGASQEDFVGREDQLATPEYPEAVKKQNLKTEKNKGRKRKPNPEEFLREEDEMQVKKIPRSKTGKPSPSEKIGGPTKAQQMKPASGKKRVNSSKSREGDTKTKGNMMNLKINGTDRFEFHGAGMLEFNELFSHEAVECPHGCGKAWTKKTSAYFRHQKSCVLARGPPFGRKY